MANCSFMLDLGFKPSTSGIMELLLYDMPSYFAIVAGVLSVNCIDDPDNSITIAVTKFTGKGMPSKLCVRFRGRKSRTFPIPRDPARDLANPAGSRTYAIEGAT
ncbi:hypothetical protein M8J77_021030 [Diaphorina citri]|nr:hypothetical protein M8J77_021030 [Diaphorina citri]